MDMSGIDWEALQRELEEYEEQEEEMDMYTLTDDNAARGPIAHSEEVDDSDTIPLGSEHEKSEDEIQFGEMITDEDVMNNSNILYPEKKLYRSLLLE